MEIFGIPVFMIVIIIIALVIQHNKEKEKAAKKWDTLRVQMSKDEVIKILGKPHRIWQAGVADTWGYGTSDSDGVVRFVNEKVIGFQKLG